MRILVFIIALLAFTNSYATSGTELNTLVENKTITVYFDSNQSKTLKISIIDQAGYVLHNEEVETLSRRSRKYNLENLPFGNYTLKIESDQSITYEAFELDREKSTIVGQRTLYKPSLEFSDNKWKLNLLALGKKVDIKILDSEFESVYKETVTNKPNVSKAFDLSELPTGVYTLSVKVGNHTFKKVVAKS